MKPIFKVILPVSLIACLLIVIAGCSDLYQTSKEDVVSNGEKTLELSASPDNIDINGAGTVTVLVHVYYSSGRPVSSAEVSLSSSLGTLTATSLTTDEDGFANTTITPGDTTGWAVVVATYKALQASVPISFYETGESSE